VLVFSDHSTCGMPGTGGNVGPAARACYSNDLERRGNGPQCLYRRLFRAAMSFATPRTKTAMVAPWPFAECQVKTWALSLLGKDWHGPSSAIAGTTCTKRSKQRLRGLAFTLITAPQHGSGERNRGNSFARRCVCCFSRGRV
jgi:hypothetical protein